MLCHLKYQEKSIDVSCMIVKNLWILDWNVCRDPDQEFASMKWKWQWINNVA